MSALGVDRAMILNDYAATDVYWKQGSSDSAQMAKTLAADPAYLQNLFTTSDTGYGLIDKFMTTEVELNPEKLTMLRTKYLQ